MNLSSFIAHRRFLCFIIPAVAVLFSFTNARADDSQAISPLFAAVLNAPQHEKALIQGAQQSSTWVNNPCKEASFARLPQLVIYRPLQFDAQGSPTGGAWKESVGAKGCGVERVLNVMTSVESPGVLRSSVLLPGTTRADPQLQRDAVRYAVIASGGPPPPSCQKAYVADTKFIDFEDTPDPKQPPTRRPWREEWTMIACEKHSIVTLHFAPDATGTIIHAGLGETRQQ